MTVTAKEALPPVDLPVRARRHSWNNDNPVTILPSEAHDGNERTERSCKLCGMVKITVHGAEGLPWREWRTKNGDRWWGQATPPCLDEVAS
jgi:hypothetical protein